MPGTHISPVEVTQVSKHGFWLLLADEELFLPFADFRGFAVQRSSNYAKLNGPLITTFFGRRWISTWRLSPYATPLLSPLLLPQRLLTLRSSRTRRQRRVPCLER